MIASTRIKLALLVALVSLALLKIGALQVCPAGRCRVLAFDASVLTTLDGWRTPALDNFFAVVTWAGSLYLLLPLNVLLALTDRRAIGYYQRGFVLLALFSNWLVIDLAKLLVARPRPAPFEALIALPADGSFPSAHAAQITAFACAWLLRPSVRSSPPVAVLLMTTVLIVCLSRLYLQVHYASDVLYGMAASALWVVALRMLFTEAETAP